MAGKPSQWASEPTCHGCPAERPVDATRCGWRGPYCRNCYHRWLYHGRPGDGPTPPPAHATGPRDGRLEDYAELRSMDHSIAEAALRLGVTKRTAERYEAALREEAA